MQGLLTKHALNLLCCLLVMLKFCKFSTWYDGQHGVSITFNHGEIHKIRGDCTSPFRCTHIRLGVEKQEFVLAFGIQRQRLKPNSTNVVLTGFKMCLKLLMLFTPLHDLCFAWCERLQYSSVVEYSIVFSSVCLSLEGCTYALHHLEYFYLLQNT